MDYADNRSYSSGQGRFTSVDPIGMSATSITNPQSLNLYAYVQNNPIDYTDPSGLFMAVNYASCRTVGYVIQIRARGEVAEIVAEIQICDTYSIEPQHNPVEHGGGGGGVSLPSHTKSSSQPNPCDDIVERIAKVLRNVAKRARELQQDFLDLVPRNIITSRDLENYISNLNDARDPARIRKQGSVESHEESFRQAQNPLRRAINDFDNNDCGNKGYNLPNGARELANSKPPGRIRPIPNADPFFSDNTIKAITVSSRSQLNCIKFEV